MHIICIKPVQGSTQMNVYLPHLQCHTNRVEYSTDLTIKHQKKEEKCINIKKKKRKEKSQGWDHAFKSISLVCFM